MNRLAVMQPYFLPYVGYFSLIHHTDFWVVMDEVQYIRRGWMHRNRILTPPGSREPWQYIALDIVHAPRSSAIRDIRLDESRNWRDRVRRQIEHYRASAPYYNDVADLAERAFAERSDSLAETNVHLLAVICDALAIDFRHEFQSRLGIVPFHVSEPQDWCLHIARQLGASTYVNPPGGEAIYSRERFAEFGIDLRFLSNNLRPYQQHRGEFVVGLSILDVMMFNDRDSVRAMVEDVSWH